MWDYQDTRRRDDRALAVRHDAANLHDYFVAADGRTPLAARLREVAAAAGERASAVVLPTRQAREARKKATVLTVFGLCLGLAGWVWFPHWFLTSHGGHEGLTFWAVGFLLAGFGAWGLLEVRAPTLASWRRAHPLVTGLLGAAATAATVWGGWEGR